MLQDHVDMALLHELARDGRASYEKLGANAGLSRTAARARVLKLMESGTVRVEAIVHPAVEGNFTFAHVSLTTESASAHRVAEEIACLDAAKFVSEVAGRFAVIAELRTGHLGDMDTAVAAIREIAGVVALDTVVYTDVVKDSHLPLGGLHDLGPFSLDDLDRKLLSLMQHEARMPYADLASRVGLSRAATRARVRRLFEDGVVVVTGLIDSTAVGFTQMCGFQVDLGPRGSAAAEAIANLEAVDFLARTLGRCDLVGTIIARDRSDVRTVLANIRSVGGVRLVEAWWHLDLVKERYSPLSLPGSPRG